MNTPETQTPWSYPFRVADLATRRPTPFNLTPTADQMRALADAMGLLELQKLRFEGEIRPYGKSDWELTGTLGATVVQPCVVTLEPVTSRIEETVTRRFLADMPEFEEGAETEMPEDETLEELGSHIDVGVVMAEALALALPLYPRAKGAMLKDTAVAPPGETPMSDEDVKPFAALKSLRDKLEGGNS